MLSLDTDQKKYQELQNRYNDLESSHINLSRENEKLKESNELLKKELLELQTSSYKNELLVNKLQHQLDILKTQTTQSNLLKKERIITPEEVQQIKKLRAEGFTYKKIKEVTGWSSVTIRRAITNIYD